MKFVIKHTGIFLALMVGLVITAHEVLPHHHHYDSTYAHVHYDACPGESGAAAHGDQAPETHCHILNEVVINRATHLQMLPEVPPPLRTLFPVFDLNAFQHITCRQISRVDIAAIRDPLFLISQSPLRAPPSAVIFT